MLTSNVVRETDAAQRRRPGRSGVGHPAGGFAGWPHTHSRREASAEWMGDCPAGTMAVTKPANLPARSRPPMIILAPDTRPLPVVPRLASALDRRSAPRFALRLRP